MNLSEAKLSFKTERLILRPYRAAEFAKWSEAMALTSANKNKFARETPKHLLTYAGFKKWVRDRRRLQKKDFVYAFGIFDIKSGDYIGTVDIAIIRRLSIQAANLGYVIHNHLWNRGYATEAAKAALIIAFKHIKVYRIEAAIEPSNHASIAVAKAIGLKKEGTRKRFYFHQGEWLDCLIYAGTAEMAGIKKFKPAYFSDVTDYL